MSLSQSERTYILGRLRKYNIKYGYKHIIVNNRKYRVADIDGSHIKELIDLYRSMPTTYISVNKLGIERVNNIGYLNHMKMKYTYEILRKMSWTKMNI